MPTMTGVKDEVVNPAKTSDDVKDIIKLTEAYTIHDVKKAWNEFTIIADKAGRITQVIILKDRELTLDGDVIRITLENVLQLEQINSFKEELMLFLRQKIRNTQITLEASVANMVEENKVYTVEDKFKFLEKKHPNLAQLKDLFGLETDY